MTDYADAYDSSGTDDDFPPPRQNINSRGGRRIPGSEETDVRAKIHQIEQEAYSSVLRAFKAQADAISWEKESLMIELRRELRLSNKEHVDLLCKVDADEQNLRSGLCSDFRVHARMDYANAYDSSGTDDDFPLPRQNRNSRGGSRIPASEETDVGAKIHQIEQGAYSSVLRAFKAQSDALSWEKESLLNELRKELRLSTIEHSDLLEKVKADETIRRIREWRETGGLQLGLHGASQAVHDTVPSPSVSSSSVPSQSFGWRSTSFRPQMVAGETQLAAARPRALVGPKGKKQKPMLPGSSSIKTQFPAGASGRGQLGNRMAPGGFPNESADDPLIGRRVRTKWPEDGKFYEAVITHFYPEDGLHVLVYDVGTDNERLEHLNLAEFPPNDIQWIEDDDNCDVLTPTPSRDSTAQRLVEENARITAELAALKKRQARTDAKMAALYAFMGQQPPDDADDEDPQAPPV